MKNNIVADISPPIPYLAKFWFSNYGPKCCQPIKLQDSLKCNISRKVNDKVYFWHADKHKVFCKLILPFWQCVTRHAQSTQNKEFDISLQYPQKNMRDKDDFCLQVNTKVLSLIF